MYLPEIKFDPIAKSGSQVCGRRLYDDFFGASPDAINRLRDYLNCLYGPTSRPTTDSNRASQQPSPNTIQPIPIRVGPPTPRDKRQTHSPNGLRRLQRHQESGSLRESNDDRIWVFPIFHKSRHGRKLIHMPVLTGESDESLFLAFNRHYSRSTNRFVRHLSLRGVVKIHFVKVYFQLLALFSLSPSVNATAVRVCRPWA